MAATRSEKKCCDGSKSKNGRHAQGNKPPVDKNLVTRAKSRFFGQNTLARADFGYVQLHILALTMFPTLESQVQEKIKLGLAKE